MAGLRIFSAHWALWMILGAMTISLGCGGGGGGGGTSLTAQYHAALDNPDPELSARQLADIGQKQLAAQDFPGAEKSFQASAAAAAKVADPAQRASVLIALAVRQSKFDNTAMKRLTVQNAEAAIDQIPQAEDKGIALANLGVVQWAVVDPDVGAATIRAAEAVAVQTEEFDAKVRILSKVADSFRRIKRPEEFDRVIAAAGDMAGEIENPSDRVKALIAVARGRAASIEKKAALPMLAEAIEAAQAIPDNAAQQGHRLLDIAEAYQQLGETALSRRAVNLAEAAISAPGVDRSTVGDVTDRISRLGG